MGACLAVVGGSGGAAAADPVPTAGAAAAENLPPLPELQRTWLNMQAAPGYVAFNDSDDEYAVGRVTVHRLSDGSAVRELTVPEGDSMFAPRLSGDAVVQVLPGTDGWTPAQFVVSDLVTGAERSRVEVPSGDVVVASAASGLLVRRSQGTGIYSQHVLTTAGSELQVGGIQPSSTWGGVGARDDVTVVQHVGDRLWAIDIATGGHRDLGAAGIYDPVHLTPNRVFWRSDTYSGTGTTTTVRWADRDGGNPGSATFTPSVYVNAYWPLGDELVAQVNDGLGYSLSPIDLATGQVGDPLVTHVVSTRPTGDGGLALAVADTPAGSLQILQPGQAGPTVVRALEPRYVPARNVLLDGDAITVDVGSAWATTPGPLLSTTVGGDGWQPAPVPAEPPAPADWSRTANGTTWTWHTDAPLISATGTTGTVRTPCVAPGGGSFEVRGRWALLTCQTGAWVVDLSGRTEAWPAPLARNMSLPALGDRFLAVVAYRTGSSGSEEAVLRVTDLSDRDDRRDYGPIHGLYGPPAPAFSVDRAGGPRLAYLDGRRQPRLVTLDWLADPGPDDIAAPAVTATGGSGPVSSDSPIRATWTASDDTSGAIPGSGVQSYDVRYRDAAATGWTSPADLQGIGVRRVTLPTAEGRTTCWAVRARDHQGNLGAWSADRCVRTDRTAPTVTAATAGPRVVSAAARSTVPFRYAGTDGTGVASYDVSYRLAARGGRLGPVTAPTGWQRTTRSSQALTVAAGGEACFSVRSRDRAGNVSAPSGWKCATVPLDDRTMTAGSHTSRRTQSGALAGTVTAMTRPGAQLELDAQRGRQVVVLAMAGPGQGKVDVYAAGVKVGRLSLAAPTWRRVTVALPARTFEGAVVLRSASSAPSRIDGLAVLRG